MTRTPMLPFVFTFVLSFSLLAGSVLAQTDSTEIDPLAGLRGLVRTYTEGSILEREGQLDSARMVYRRGAELVPGSPYFELAIARTSAKLADTGSCLRALRSYADLGATYDLSTEEAFTAMTDQPEFQAVAAKLAANGVTPEPASIVARLHDEHLWNEGIACDRQTGDLYAGSVKQSKIVRFANGRQEDFGTTADDDLLEVIGLDIDEKRRHLWAVIGRDDAEPGAPHDFGEAPRRNAIVVYDLQNGRQLQHHPLIPDERIHMWNDVSVAPNGVAYFTDMQTAEIYRIRPGHDYELFLALEDLNYINGLAVSDDGERLYVVGVEGMLVIDLPDGEQHWLTGDEPMCLGLGDGIAVAGRDLFIVQNNQLLNMRILHCRLDDSGYGVQSTEALLCGLPEGLMAYTCAVGDDVLYVNGTAPFAQYDAEEPPPASVIVELRYK